LTGTGSNLISGSQNQKKPELSGTGTSGSQNQKKPELSGTGTSGETLILSFDWLSFVLLFCFFVNKICIILINSINSK